jgi:hypothetical protein
VAEQLISPPPTRGPAGARGSAPVDRRGFLRTVGLGIGTLAVAGAAGVTWSTISGGVFATGTGPAYAAWDELLPPPVTRSGWSAPPCSPPTPTTPSPGTSPSRRTASTCSPTPPAPSAPWTRCCVRCTSRSAARWRTSCWPGRRTATPPPSPSCPTRPTAATSHASTSPPPQPPCHRCSRPSRAATPTAPPTTPPDRFDALRALVDAPGSDLVWFTSTADKHTFADLTIRATEAIIADPQQSDDDAAWYRDTWQEIQSHKDGITVDPSGSSPFIRTYAKLLPVTRQQNNDGWLSGTRNTQIPTASAFGALVVTDPGNLTRRLQVGRLWQRLHLTATAAGVSLQPLCQVPERIDREQSAGIPTDVSTAMATLLPAGQHPLMTFRIGHPTTDALRSPRRPAEEVVLS